MVRHGRLRQLPKLGYVLAEFGRKRAEAGETACPTKANSGLATVARAVSPARTEFCKSLSGMCLTQVTRVSERCDGGVHVRLQ